MKKRSNNQLTKLINKTIKNYQLNSEKLLALTYDDYLLLSQFSSLMELVNIVLLLSDDTKEDERYCVMHLLSHGLIQYQVEYENSEPYKTDFTLARSIESLILRQIPYLDLNGFFVAREIVSSLFSANIQVNEDFLIELNNAEYLCDEVEKNNEHFEIDDLMLHFEKMVEAFEADSDYEIYLQIAEQLNQMPAEAAQLMFNSMLQTKHILSRDASILLLLHPLNKVRDTILDGLCLFAEQSLLNAKDYNRLLILRNWVKDNDKKTLDKAIKLIQKAQISFEYNAQSDRKTIHNLLLTPIDNGGSMAIQVAFKQSTKFIVFGCVLKQGYGVKDVFITEPLTKASYQQLLVEASNGLPMCTISFEQFEALLSHFLKLNLKEATSVPAEILLLKEYTGADWLNPHQIDQVLVENYLLKANKKIDPAFELDDFIIGWASPEFLKKHETKTEIIIQEMEPYREIWYERLKLTCFCFAENIADIDMFIDSIRQIKSGAKLNDIRLFQAIAEQVLENSLSAENDLMFLPEGFTELIEAVTDDAIETEDHTRLELIVKGEVDLDLVELSTILNKHEQLKLINENRPTRKVYQIKIILSGTKPLVWRRLFVMNTISLVKLHDIIQVAMGWSDQYGYQFQTKELNCHANQFDEFVLDDKQLQLRDCLIKEKSKLLYLYDIENEWRHQIILEKILPAKKKNTPAQILKSVGACPPESKRDINSEEELTPIKIDLEKLNKILASL